MVRHSSRLRGQRFTHWGHGFQRGILGSVIESRWVDYLGRMFTFPRNGAPHGFCWKNLLFISEFISDAHGIECQVLREIGPRFQVIGHLALRQESSPKRLVCPGWL